MKCPTCGSAENAVIKSESESDAVRRRRQCGACGFRWSTVEIEAGLHKRTSKALEMLDMAGTIARGAAIAVETVHDPVTHREVQVDTGIVVYKA